MVRIILALFLCWPLMPGVQYEATEYATCDSDSDIDDMTALTVAIWGRMTETLLAHTVAAKGVFNGGGWDVEFRPDLTNCMGLVVDGTTGNLNHRASSGNCAANETHHYAVTWNGLLGGSASVAFYYDGTATSKAATADGSGTMVSDASNSLYLGRTSSGSQDEGFDFACVAIWEAQLSAEAVATLAAGGCRAALKVQSASLRRLYEIFQPGTIYDLLGDRSCTETGTTAFQEIPVAFK